MSPPMEDEAARTRSHDPSELRMSSEAMLELAQTAAELLVRRLEELPDEAAWRGASADDVYGSDGRT